MDHLISLEKQGILQGFNPAKNKKIQNIANLLIDHSHVGIFLLNDTYTCIYANHKISKIVGRPVKQIVGSDFRDYIPEDCVEAVDDLYLRRQKGESVPGSYEVDFIHKNGKRRTVEIRVDAIQIGDGGLITAVQAFDITERKQAELDLKNSEKKYHDFFENILDFIFIHDLEGNIIESNARYVTEVGGKPDVIATSNLRDLMPEKYQPGFDDYLKRIKINGRDEGIVAIQVSKDEIRILEYKNIALYDDDNRPLNVLGSARDITEHTRDKRELRAAKERYQMILENVEDYIYELDLAGNYTFVNEALARRSDYTRDELIGKNYREYTLPEEKDDFQKYHYSIYKTGKTGKQRQFRVIRKNGAVTDIELVVSLIRDDNGQPIGFRGVARDITERKLAEKIQREGEQRLMEIIEGSPIPTIVFNRDNQITHWNRACSELTNIKPNIVSDREKTVAETLIGQPILPDFLNRKVSLTELSAFYGSICRKSKIVKNAYEVETFFPHLGKKGKWLFLTLAFLKDRENNITGVIETLLDVTTQKQAELKLLKMHEALEEKVEGRTLELQEVNIALEVLLKKREKDKQKFENKVAYSINEILTPHLELLKATNLDKHQKIYLEILEDNFHEIASPFIANIVDKTQKLTSTEIQVISLIKQNKISKEIADFMGISTRTVETHRNNIRKKLGIQNRKINLRSYLLNTEQL